MGQGDQYNFTWEKERIKADGTNGYAMQKFAYFTKTIDVKSYSQLIIEGHMARAKSDKQVIFYLVKKDHNNEIEIVLQVSASAASTSKMGLNISSLTSIPVNYELWLGCHNSDTYINRIRLA